MNREREQNQPGSEIEKLLPILQQLNELLRIKAYEARNTLTHFKGTCVPQGVSRPTVQALMQAGFIPAETPSTKLSSLQGKITKAINARGEITRPAVPGFHPIYGPTNMRVGHYLITKKIAREYYRMSTTASKPNVQKCRDMFNQWAVAISSQERAALLAVSKKSQAHEFTYSQRACCICEGLGMLSQFLSNRRRNIPAGSEVDEFSSELTLVSDWKNEFEKLSKNLYVRQEDFDDYCQQLVSGRLPSSQPHD